MPSVLGAIEPNDLLRLITRAQERLLAEIVQQLEPLDLSLDLMDLIYAVDGIGGGTPAEIGTAWKAEPEIVAAGIRTLQLRGILTRPRPKDDPETTRLRFTTEGRDKIKRAHIALQRTFERAGGWLGAQREPLTKGLLRLAELPPGNR